jgi:hypothetical protein
VAAQRIAGKSAGLEFELAVEVSVRGRMAWVRVPCEAVALVFRRLEPLLLTGVELV